jgi:hypothetical protein
MTQINADVASTPNKAFALGSISTLKAFLQFRDMTLPVLS